MTLLVALKGEDGLVLAADSRGTFGDPRGVTAQNDSQQKAHVVADHAAVLAAGAGELGILIVNGVAEQVKQAGADGVTPVVDELRRLARERYKEWFPSLPPVQPPPAVAQQIAARPDISFIIGGYDRDAGGSFTIPKIYSCHSSYDYPPMLHDYGFAVAGVPQYALYLLNRLYEEERSVQDLTALAVYVITETASQDGKVGGPVRVVTVKPDEGCTLLDAAEVERIAEDNENRAQSLRDSFYGGSSGRDG